MHDTIEKAPSQIDMETIQFVEVSPTDEDRATQVHQLLTDSTTYFKYSNGGHVPDNIVDTVIHKNFVSMQSIQDTFAESGRRFALEAGGRVLSTILVSRDPGNIFIIDKDTYNVDQQDYPEYSPADYHNVINFAVDRRYRGLGLARLTLQSLGDIWDEEFTGRGISFRSEPSLINRFLALGAEHLVGYDKFSSSDDSPLPPAFNNVREFNELYMPDVPGRPAEHYDLATHRRYKYALMVKEF